ncbi:hypothetical protein DYB25_000482 [Aphanomyces astaci]|uniref:Uncharacterized protein n=1 Tax=Aphanomyces astaci TaxID=112090 RepID=A0A397B5G1_APHAT|nr:hypothetical protein DYB25_000482 [Aphanomyces astaci]RHY55815.1 hypothetical protein DYB34_001383 [Aphanomyces astaci]RHY61927.1 hypothetical protein DYB38_004591 [Aphanomyces astaci]RHZ12946.1 hypothetical protein DYB31_000403 [Aphanomyces astaci]RHZ26706.1 hypothetical protein DYB26_002767 [Aphanomyces astaci]
MFTDPLVHPAISSATLSCPVETRYYLVASGGLTATWFVVGLVAYVSHTQPPAMPVLAILHCFATIVVGIVGAILGAHKGCAQANPTLFALTIATSCLFVTVCVPLMGILVHYVVRNVSAPGSSSGCREPFVLFLIVSSGLFGFILGLALWCYLHPQSTASYLACLLLGHGIASVAWATVGTIWIRTDAASPAQCSPGLVSAVHHLRMMLFVLGILVTTLTCCCKLERVCLPLVVPTESQLSTVQIV